MKVNVIDWNGNVSGTIRVKPTMTVWEYHYPTKETSKMDIKKGESAFELHIRKDCLYRQFRNRKTAEKFFAKTFKDVK